MEITLNKKVTYEDVTEINYNHDDGITVIFKLTDGSTLKLNQEEVFELKEFLSNLQMPDIVMNKEFSGPNRIININRE